MASLTRRKIWKLKSLSNPETMSVSELMADRVCSKSKLQDTDIHARSHFVLHMASGVQR